jgi:transcriptional regulator with XRE-family HTH domain
MTVFEQLQQRRSQLGKTLQSLANLTAMSVPQVSNVLSGKLDSWLSACEALADAMDASLVLIPKHLNTLPHRPRHGEAGQLTKARIVVKWREATSCLNALEMRGSSSTSVQNCCAMS